MGKLINELEIFPTHSSSSNVASTSCLSRHTGIINCRRVVEFPATVLSDSHRYGTVPQYFVDSSVLPGGNWLPIHVRRADAPSRETEIPAVLSCMGLGIFYRGVGKRCRNLCWRYMSQNRRRRANVLHFPRLLRSHIATLSARTLVIKINE